MQKKEVLKFIKDRVEVLELLKARQFAGKFTRAEQAEYLAAYQYLEPKARLCFTCGRSPELMANAMLKFYEENKPKRRKK